MLGTFPKDFPIWQLPKCAISQVHIANCTFGGLPLRKLSLGKSPLGKCLWEST